jgi:hypothetical protein
VRLDLGIELIEDSLDVSAVVSLNGTLERVTVPPAASRYAIPIASLPWVWVVPRA